MDEIPPDQPRPVFSIRPEHEPFFLPGNCSLLSVRPSPDLSASSSLQKSVVTHTDRSASVSEGDPHKLFSAVSDSPQPIESHHRNPDWYARSWSSGRSPHAPPMKRRGHPLSLFHFYTFVRYKNEKEIGDALYASSVASPISFSFLYICAVSISRYPISNAFLTVFSHSLPYIL